MIKKILSSFVVLALISAGLLAQEEEVEDLLREEVVNVDPIYKPVIGIGSGVFNFYGDVRNNYVNPQIGNYAYKMNVSTFLDERRFYTVNLMFMYGQVSANERSITDPERNLNFKTDLVTFGLNIEYNFHHFIPGNKLLRPFVSAGIENIQFTPKADLRDANNNLYHYWSDGQIRNIPESLSDTEPPEILYRDYIYETDLRQRERELHDLGTYSKNTFAIPVDLGVNLKITDRMNLKIGTSLHYTFSDFIDNVSSEGTSVKGKKGNDILSYNYFSLHFDLFSEPKSIVVEKMFAEYEFDEVMLGDEDGDFILDAIDQCPQTPYGVAVDTLGCPLDEDNDGVPDYQDKEKFSPPGVWVDDEGVMVTEEEFLRQLSKRSEAMKREEVLAYFETIGDGYTPRSTEDIPDKFRSLDLDEDGYISFEELLHTIDRYFEGSLDLKVEDIYELNNFFFRQ
jgi:hypothetical protein